MPEIRGLLLCWKSSPFSVRSLPHAWPKTTSDRDRSRGSAGPSTDRSEPDPALVSSPARPHPLGDRRRWTDPNLGLPDPVQRIDRPSHLPPLRTSGAIRPPGLAPAVGTPDRDFPPATRPDRRAGLPGARGRG